MSEFTDHLDQIAFASRRAAEKMNLKADPMDDAMPNLPAPSRRHNRGCARCWFGKKPCDGVCLLEPTETNAMHAVEGHPQLELFEPAELAAIETNIASASERGAGDAVNLPNHYARFKIEPIRFMVENLGPGILVGKVIKYTMRYDAKNGMEDLKKAKRCIELLIKFTAGDPDWWQRDTEAVKREEA